MKHFVRGDIVKVDLGKREIVYLLDLLYSRKCDLGLRTIEEEKKSEEYQFNASLRVKLEDKIY